MTAVSTVQVPVSGAATVTSAVAHPGVGGAQTVQSTQQVAATSAIDQQSLALLAQTHGADQALLGAEQLKPPSLLKKIGGGFLKGAIGGVGLGFGVTKFLPNFGLANKAFESVLRGLRFLPFVGHLIPGGLPGALLAAGVIGGVVGAIGGFLGYRREKAAYEAAVAAQQEPAPVPPVIVGPDGAMVTIDPATGQPAVPPAEPAPAPPPQPQPTTGAPAPAPAAAASKPAKVPTNPAAKPGSDVRPAGAKKAGKGKKSSKPSAKVRVVEYRLGKGDSLAALAKHFRTSVAAILAANKGRISNPNKLKAGTVIRIPIG